MILKDLVMIIASATKITNPLFSAELLAGRLWPYKKANAIIAATTPKTEPMALRLGTDLHLPVIQQHCKSLRHPGRTHETIGSMTADEVVLHENSAQLPQGYIEHQVALLKHHLKRNAQHPEPDVKDKTVIVIRQEIYETDQVLALIESFKKAKPTAIIVATPLIKRNVRLKLEKIVDHVVYITEESPPLFIKGKDDLKPFGNSGMDRYSRSQGSPALHWHQKKI